MSDAAEYARQIETYLCRRNGGHLVRLVGPAFEMVCGWAASGLPLKVAFRGIDRCCARQEGKGSRRRPVRVEFCEADVLDAFDEWRRAVGVSASAGADDPGGAPAEEAPARRPALAAHVERAIARLAHARGPGPPSTPLHHEIDAIVRELEGMAAACARARGEARARLVGRLRELDERLIQAAVAGLEATRADALRAEAAAEIAPFAARMSADVREQSAGRAFTRLLRQSLALPALEYE